MDSRERQIAAAASNKEDYDKMTEKLTALAIAASALLCGACAYSSGEEHLKQFANGVPGDKTIEAASKLNITVPVMCREWHIWWGAPYGQYTHNPIWTHWNNEKIYGVYNPATTIEQTAPGSSWRRNLNCTGYPLLGPYDPAQPDIIRWQLESARNAGLECLHVHLWPSLWDDGKDFTPIEIYDTVLDTAAKMNYPVAFHDEIMFRRPNITKAQSVESSVKRTSMLLKRYAKHPGFYKIDGMPVYYFQNWSKWLSPEDMAKYFEAVEKEAGPVYWMVEGPDNEKVFSIPQVKMVFAHNNSWFLHAEPLYGMPPHPWDKLMADLKRASELARKSNKKLGILVYTRFNATHDRAEPGKGVIPADDGMFFVESLKRMQEFKPDCIVLTQWNDFEECAFIEPAWDFDGFNGDPYRYCRIVAASMGKSFKPAPLPERSQLDPFIRRKLFGDSKPGDMGPVFQNPKLEGESLKADWTDGPKASELRIVQGELARWTPADVEYKGQKLRLGNYSALDGSGMLKPGGELRFYAPGLVSKEPKTLWLGIRCKLPEKTKLSVEFHSNQEYFRTDSRWDSRVVQFDYGITAKCADGSTRYWAPVYDSMLNGKEGDILVRTKGDKAPVEIKDVVLWSPEMAGGAVAPAAAMPLPKGLAKDAPFVAVAYDGIGNPGLPRIIDQD